MITIEVDKLTPFEVEGKSITSISVKPIGFVAYARNRSNASRKARTDNEAARLELRGRMKMQAACVTSEGKSLPMTDDIITKLPFKTALKLKDALADALFPNDAASPEILAKGNGVTTPILIKLGTPIKYTGDKQIAELEFLVDTMGQLEDVVIADGDLERTIEFILHGAKPADPTFISLPSTAAESISVADGLFIMRNVTSAFFE